MTADTDREPTRWTCDLALLGLRAGRRGHRHAMPSRWPVRSRWRSSSACTAAHADSPRFAEVLSCCSMMVGDRPVTTGDPEQVLVQPGATVEFLPPFAGG